MSGSPGAVAHSPDEPSSLDDRDTTPPAPVIAPGRPVKPVACRRCHSRKVRCSGGLPCENCRQASKAAECTYPRRSRLVKVDQRYIDDLLRDNQRLRAQLDQAPAPRPEPSQRPVATQTQQQVSPEILSRDKTSETDPAAQAPSLAEGPWFFNLNIPHTPILIGETSDAGFATRFRQAIATSSAQKTHIPRTNYPSDERLLTLYDIDCAWPSLARARLLVRVALKHVAEDYHIVRKSEALSGLESTFANPQLSDSFFNAKLWALFAIGEMYSTRTTSRGNDFPGMGYFARATRILRIVSERPRIDAIEIRLLLSFYSLAMNRRHSAYALAGSAARLSVVMGMHLNVPESYLSDPGMREHRNRVWWTAYSFDRMWAINLSNPVAVPEESINVELPSDLKLPGCDDFGDPSYYTARVGLARLSGRIAWSIYGIKRGDRSLSQRVQEALTDLREWDGQLPGHLRIDSNVTSDRHPNAESLHLSFNQCVICATRPILLHVLRVHVASWSEPRSEPKVPASAMTLAEACTRCARQSIRLLMDCWIEGSFATFDYFYAQNLFSATTILAMSSLLDGKESRSDMDQFEAAAHVLSQLKDSGHLAAEEFCRHVDAYRAAMANQIERKRGFRSAAEPGALQVNGGSAAGTQSAPPAMQMDVSTAENLHLPEPSLQELLTQSSLDLQFIDQSLYQESPQGLYWPEMYTEGWSNDTWVPT